jgi:hypothetical protein
MQNWMVTRSGSDVRLLESAFIAVIEVRQQKRETYQDEKKREQRQE